MIRGDIETKIAMAVNDELCRQIDNKEPTDTHNVTAKIVALPCIQTLIDDAAQLERVTRVDNSLAKQLSAAMQKNAELERQLRDKESK